MAIKATGTVKFFNTDRGFGFFTTTDGVDVFVLQSMLKQFGFAASDMIKGAPAIFEYEIDRKRGKPRTTSISSINDKAAVAMSHNEKAWSKPASQRPTNGVIVLQLNDTVFGFITSIKREGAVLSIVARLRDDGVLVIYDSTKRPSLLVPLAKVPKELQSDFTVKAGYFYKLIVSKDEQQNMVGCVIHIATDDDAPASAKVEPVALTGIGSRGQPIMELGDPISTRVTSAELPPHITDGAGLRTMQMAGHA